MRDEEFKPVDNLKRKCRFCFGTRVLRVLTFSGNLRLSSIKLQKVQKVQKDVFLAFKNEDELLKK